MGTNDIDRRIRRTSFQSPAIQSCLFDLASYFERCQVVAGEDYPILNEDEIHQDLYQLFPEERILEVHRCVKMERDAAELRMPEYAQLAVRSALRELSGNRQFFLRSLKGDALVRSQGYCSGCDLIGPYEQRPMPPEAFSSCRIGFVDTYYYRHFPKQFAVSCPSCGSGMEVISLTNRFNFNTQERAQFGLAFYESNSKAGEKSFKMVQLIRGFRLSGLDLNRQRFVTVDSSTKGRLFTAEQNAERILDAIARRTEQRQVGYPVVDLSRWRLGHDTDKYQAIHLDDLMGDGHPLETHITTLWNYVNHENPRSDLHHVKYNKLRFLREVTDTEHPWSNPEWALFSFLCETGLFNTKYPAMKIPQESYFRRFLEYRKDIPDFKREMDRWVDDEHWRGSKSV